jgi:hypothetical protein
MGHPSRTPVLGCGSIFLSFCFVTHSEQGKIGIKFKSYGAENFRICFGWVASLLDACAWGLRETGCATAGAAKLPA